MAVALDLPDRAIEAGERALAETAEGQGALGRYLHSSIDVGLGALSIIYPYSSHPAGPTAESAPRPSCPHWLTPPAPMGEINAARGAEEIVYAVLRFGRPLPIGLPLQEQRDIAHAQVDTFLAGMATHARVTAA